MKIGHAMNRNPVRVNAGATFAEAAKLVSHHQVSELMVVDDGGRLVGVVSEGDLIRATLPRYEDLIREGAPLSSAWELFLERGEELRTAPISRIMIDKPIVFKPTDDLVKVASVMIMRQIHMLPVVEGGLLVGTISRGDVCHAVLGER